MEQPNTQNLTLEDEVATKMDQATKELSSFIQFLCDKYGAEFIVQKVIFSFVPKMEQLDPNYIEAQVKDVDNA